MNIYHALKTIAENNEIREKTTAQLSEQIDIEGYDLSRAKLISGCSEKNGGLYDKDGDRIDNSGLVNGDYYCYQLTGYMEDDFFGTVYYATDVPDTFVAIPFCFI